MLSLQNIDDVKKKLQSCDISTFKDSGCSFKKFITSLHVIQFRHINNVEISFTHPVTVVSGSNKIGKTSILLLLACSHENFMKLDSTNTETTLRTHAWKDVIRFTKYENDAAEYAYEMHWRIGLKECNGTGKRVGTKHSWIGLAKKSQTRRMNSKIKDFEVRLIDLDRVCPARDVSRRLHLKVNKELSKTELSKEICQAFSYIFELNTAKIFQVGEHISKICYLIETGAGSEYSSYSTASGEDAVINILRDIFETPHDALILIDELEAGFHPSVQRRLADIIQYVSWNHKKQFIITTHSPTLMSSFPQVSRRFIETKDGGYNVIPKISTMAAFSKMDVFSHPLLRIYCEDSLAGFLLRKTIVKLSENYPAFNRLVNIVDAGPACKVKEYYLAHKKIFQHMLPKIGYCCVIDGDYFDSENFQELKSDDGVFFLTPHEAPEKFLAKAYLAVNPSPQLQAFLTHSDHHLFFQKLCDEGKATDVEDARNMCFNAFSSTHDYNVLETKLYEFIKSQTIKFSELADTNG